MPFVTVYAHDLVSFVTDITRVISTPASRANSPFVAKLWAVSKALAVVASDYSWQFGKRGRSVVLICKGKSFFNVLVKEVSSLKLLIAVVSRILSLLTKHLKTPSRNSVFNPLSHLPH